MHMNARPITVLLAIVALLLLVACGGEPIPTSPAATQPTAAPGGEPTPSQARVAQETPPCTPISGSSVDPCEPDVAMQRFALRGAGGIPWAYEFDRPETIREMFDDAPISFIPHLVVRGTFIPDTARCISGNPYRVPSYVDDGGATYNGVGIECYADVRVNAYIIGSGPARLTVQMSYYHYGDGWFESMVAGDESRTPEEMEELFRQLSVSVLEHGDRTEVVQGIYGREVMLFIGPSHNHATQVWEVLTMWDVQRPQGGTAVAVHPWRDIWRDSRPNDYQTHRAALEMPLATFAQAVTTAHQARVTAHGGRIGPANIEGKAPGTTLPMITIDTTQLTQYLTSTGDYSHPDGPPTLPPLPCGLAVTDRADKPALPSTAKPS